MSESTLFSQPAPDRRRATNISLPAALLAEAKAHSINLSRACEAGLRLEVEQARRARWLQDNRAALESSNRWAVQHGLPLASLRRF